MRLLHRVLHRPTAIGLLVIPALAFSATQARAAGESITMVQDGPTVVAGQAATFTASGTLNPADTMFGFDVYIFVKDPDLDPTCAADFETEEATAMNSAGREAWVSPPLGFQVGTSGTFSQPFKFTFTGSGHYLFCGYVQSDFSTAASAELRGFVSAAPGHASHTQSVPAVVRPPSITRRGRVLVCHGGNWSNSPSSLRYRWYLRRRVAAVASGRTVRVRGSWTGRRVRCRVTARNAAGARTASSRWVVAR